MKSSVMKRRPILSTKQLLLQQKQVFLEVQPLSYVLIILILALYSFHFTYIPPEFEGIFITNCDQLNLTEDEEISTNL